MEFIATYSTTDHREVVERKILADDIDDAAREAVRSCPADEFVVGIRQADFSYEREAVRQLWKHRDTWTREPTDVRP